MINSGTLIRTFVERGNYADLRQHHTVLHTASRYIGAVGHDDLAPGFRCLISYADSYKRYPSLAELEEFTLSSQHLPGDAKSRGMWALALKELMGEPGAYPAYAGGWDQLLDEYVLSGRRHYYSHALRVAEGKIIQGATLPGEKDDSQSESQFIAAAMKYLDEARRSDFTLPASAPEGAWRENAEIGADVLLDGLRDTIKDRCYTGFQHVDAAVTIGPKQSIKYIGILGFSNHGKSMYMRTMAYNMAKSGKRILFIAREDTALNTWTQLSFLHSYAHPRLDIPPINTWRNQPKRVTTAQQDNLRVLIDDLQNGTNVPGEIVVKTLGKWPDIVQELEHGLNGEPYDVLMIDYLSHLDTGATGNRIYDEVKGLFKQAQALAIDYKANRGLVVVTPLQAGKKPMSEADAAEAEDWGVYNGLGAVDYYTDACRDMDLVISVWHKGQLKNDSMMKIACMKSREDFFETHFVAIDRRTRMVMDLPGAAKADISKIAIYKTELYDASLSAEEITIGSGG